MHVDVHNLHLHSAQRIPQLSNGILVFLLSQFQRAACPDQQQQHQKKKPPPVSKCTVKMQLLQSSFERRVTAPMHNLTASYACSDVIMHVGVVDVIASSKYKLAYMLNTYEYTCLTQVILWISVFCSFQLFVKDPETIQTNINSSNTFLLIYKIHI